MVESAASRFLLWMETSFPAAVASLRAPATPEAVERIRRVTGHEVPATLRQLWLLHDGQEDAAGRRIFEDFAWMSVKDALSSADMMKQVLDEAGRDYDSQERWFPEWLPFAQDIGGGLLVVDLARGDVFEWQSDGEGRGRTCGNSFDGFLDGYLERFARGELRVDGSTGVVDLNPTPLAVSPVSGAKDRRKRDAMIVVIVVLVALAAIIVVAMMAVRGV